MYFTYRFLTPIAEKYYIKMGKGKEQKLCFQRYLQVPIKDLILQIDSKICNVWLFIYFPPYLGLGCGYSRLSKVAHMFFSQATAAHVSGHLRKRKELGFRTGAVCIGDSNDIELVLFHPWH